MMIGFGIVLLFILKEPPVIKSKEERQQSGGALKMALNLSKQIWAAVKQNKDILVGWIMLMLSGGVLVIFEIYLMSWLNGFFNKETGPIYDIDTVYRLYQLQGIIGCSLAFVILGFVGKVTDKVSIKIILPLSLMFRAVVFFLIYKIKDPTSFVFYLIVPFAHVSYYSVVIGQQAYLLRLYPKEIRGMCQAVATVFVNAGTYFSLLYYQALYREGFRLPFIGVTMLDIFVAISVVLLVAVGRFKPPPKS